jgi:hypothetical protein
MDPSSIAAITSAAAQTVGVAVGAGFDYGKAQLQAGVDKQAIVFGQTTDLSAQGWNAITSLNNSTGFNQALANKYANRSNDLFGQNPNWMPWAIAAAVAVVVLIIVIRR